MSNKVVIGARALGLKRRVFTREFKVQVIGEIEGGKSLAQAAREHRIGENTLWKWRKQYRDYGEDAFAGRGHPYSEEAQIKALERKVGQLTMENDFLKKLLQKWGHKG